MTPWNPRTAEPPRARSPGRRSVALALVATLAAAPACAEEDAEGALGKAGRGLAAVATGLLEVPGNVVASTRERGAAVGVPLGLAKGLGMTVVRELVGVYELVTAPVPAPDDYAPILQPEYPWSYFGEREEPALRPGDGGMLAALPRG